MIKSIDHVALSVADLDRSLTFYRDLFGFEVIRILECGPEMRLGDVNGMPDSTARIAHLQLGTSMLELFEYQHPRGKAISSEHKQADHGFTHLGFTSSNARADYERLKKHGIKFFSEPIEFRPDVWIFYFYGPDGEVCEVRES
jgi:catechol 2,3-dioxygenase-like lactoylglutathione lyase family enzyme